MKKLFIILAAVFIVSCNNCKTAQDTEQAKKEILDTEHEFMKMAQEAGLSIAFSTFADSGAVIRNDKSLIKGIDSIRVFYQNNTPQSAKLIWNATFVDVAASCDLGYTYGTYSYLVKDPMGSTIESKGFFHTVWKKQADGKWKFVWD